MGLVPLVVAIVKNMKEMVALVQTLGAGMGMIDIGNSIVELPFWILIKS
jgi:hypothetical protein